MKTQTLGGIILAVVLGCTGRAPAVRSAATTTLDAAVVEAPSDASSAADGSMADAPTADAAPPAPLPPHVVSIAMGEWHGCAVMSDGSARCWGRNRESQLGAAEAPSVASAPTPVVGLPGGVVQVSAGTFHTCARTEGGQAFCWGDNRTGQIGLTGALAVARPTELRALTEVAEIVTGRDQSCARLRDGTVRCWGNNENGQLGDGTLRARFAPTAVVTLRDVAELAAGSGHTCARLADGTVRCWGLNRRGQLGDRTRVSRNRPVPVIGVDHAVQLALGREHGCARLEDGTVRCWGRNDVGQLGNGTVLGSNVALRVRGLRGVRHLAAGGLHTCAVLADATVWCWGSNHHGQLGLGTLGGVRREPTLAAGLSSVAALALSRAADDGASCALREDRTVHCWGDNAAGQLGRAPSPASPTATAAPLSAPLDAAPPPS